MDFVRRDQILKYIVEHFIKTASPVGSHTLIDVYKLPFSSATIRNEMLALESDGLLEKTHTSSGRIPSNKGYRYYVEFLRNKSIDERLKNQLQTMLSERSRSVTEVIQKSSEILANMTNLASVVLGPTAKQERLMNILITPLENNSATVVFITDSGYVENKTFVLPSSIDKQNLTECISLINTRLKGTAVADLIDKMDAIKPIIEDFITEHDILYQTFAQTFINFASERLKLYGKNELYTQPEFAHDAEKLRNIIALLESPTLLSSFDDEVNRMSIKIGTDGQANDNVSILSSKLRMPGEKESRIAIVGPTRMDYDRVLTALEYVTSMLERYFQNLNDKKEE
jgi:heat-inducible transcriptional repressor